MQPRVGSLGVAKAAIINAGQDCDIICDRSGFGVTQSKMVYVALDLLHSKGFVII